jgi:hypothetical protein
VIPLFAARKTPQSFPFVGKATQGDDVPSSTRQSFTVDRQVNNAYAKEGDTFAFLCSHPHL